MLSVHADIPAPTKITSTPAAFSLAQARHIVRDLFQPNPIIYWTDLLVSALAGHGLFSLVRAIPQLVAGPAWLVIGLQAVCFLASALCLYRAALFIHELTHLPHKEFKAFRIAWNLLIGIPFMMPSFVYYTHIDHHRRKHFGTDHDGEYMRLGLAGPWYWAYYLALSFVLPLQFVARFMFLTPLCALHPAIKKWVYTRTSAMVMDPLYIRPYPTKNVLAIIALQEWACCIVCWVTAVIAVGFGSWPFPILLQAYATGLFVIGLNAIRTSGAHRWWNDGRELTFVDQMLDSVTVADNPWVSELWGPVGTRFHSIHHLFPSLPYHNLSEAHRRLMAKLPADSPYRQTVEPSLTASLWSLWKRTRSASAGRVVHPQFTATPILLDHQRSHAA
jgi:fatty acid desaturase